MGWSRIKDFGAKGGVTLILTAIVISALVSIFSSFYYSNRFLEYKAKEIETLFREGGDFSQVAKDVLGVRPDVAYIRLLSENGILKESFGDESVGGVREFELRTAGNDTVMLGIREFASKDSIFYPALWSVLIGGGLAGICLFLLFLFSPDQQGVHLERLTTAMKRVSRGDFTAKLDFDESVYGNATMGRVLEGFNQMVDQLRKKDGAVKEAAVFQPAVVVTETKKETKLRRVVAFVAKISDFEDLSARLGAAEFTSFLTDYRKAASSIISDYGGVVEALLQDEIVALFNVPDEQDRPELRAVCAAVEVLQVLAGMSRQRKIEGKNTVSGKIGIGEKALTFYTESGIPQNVREVVTLARGISEDAPLWGVLVPPGLYKSLGDHVEARELALGGKTFFSIVSVEEGVVEV